MELTDFFCYLGMTLLGITTLVASIKYQKFKSKFVLFFILFLYASLITELLGTYVSEIMGRENFLVYHIYTLFEFNLIFLVYFHLIRDDKTLKMMKILAVIFNVTYFFGLIIFSLLTSYTINIMLESLILSVFCIIYLKELLNSDKILNFKKHLPFWITTGLIIFYLSSIPFQLIRKNLENRDLTFIQPAINYLMYFCFIYGFTWSKKN